MSSLIKKQAQCTSTRDDFAGITNASDTVSRGRYHAKDDKYKPAVGDIVYIVYPSGGHHVQIIVEVDSKSNKYTTIEGNSSAQGGSYVNTWTINNIKYTTTLEGTYKSTSHKASGDVKGFCHLDR